MKDFNSHDHANVVLSKWQQHNPEHLVLGPVLLSDDMSPPRPRTCFVELSYIYIEREREILAHGYDRIGEMMLKVLGMPPTGHQGVWTACGAVESPCACMSVYRICK